MPGTRTVSRRRFEGLDYYVIERLNGEVLCGTDLGVLTEATPEVLIAPLLVPCVPSKIVCIGLNYRQHAAEMGKPLPAEPVVFLKPTTALIAAGQSILLPPESNEVHFEGELAVVIGKRTRRVAADDALACVRGYTILNDVTARDIQRRDGRYTRAKGFDTFAPCGPRTVCNLQPEELTLQTHVNGELRQSSALSDMIFTVPQLVEYVSSLMTLLPGDIISTGTPAGVGPLAAGDVVEIRIDGIGVLGNPVSNEIVPG
jgi:2-keto-4-pentenoate hydratase/2-oxohepta-3-ene-1,7-dioic acid hydratase in catechol pathway